MTTFIPHPVSFERTFIFFDIPGIDANTDNFVIANCRFDPKPGDRMVVPFEGKEFVLTFDRRSMFVEHPTLNTETGVITYAVRASIVIERDRESRASAFEF